MIPFPFFTAMCSWPPEVENAKPMGDRRDRYPVNSIVRYQCDSGFTQRHLPVERCLPDGRWEEPQVECIGRKWDVQKYILDITLIVWQNKHTVIQLLQEGRKLMYSHFRRHIPLFHSVNTQRIKMSWKYASLPISWQHKQQTTQAIHQEAV